MNSLAASAFLLLLVLPVGHVMYCIQQVSAFLRGANLLPSPSADARAGQKTTEEPDVGGRRHGSGGNRSRSEQSERGRTLHATSFSGDSVGEDEEIDITRMGPDIPTMGSDFVVR